MNKEQKKAVEDLVLDLDELENKPNRLFYALEEFAFAFNKDNAVPSIREAQDMYYKHYNEGEMYGELYGSLRRFKIEEWDRQIRRNPEDLSETQDRIYGAEDFIKTHIRNLTEIL